MARLGYPDGERQIMGDTIYIWSTSHNTSMPLVNTSNTTGMVGNVPVYGTTSSTQWVPMNFNCTVQFAVGPDSIIKGYKWSGNEGGCKGFARALHFR